MGIFGSRRQQEPEPPVQPERERPAHQPQPPQQPIPQQQPIGFETVLGSSSSLEGSLVSHSNVRLDGSFTGKLEINGNVLIGETAKITADVSAKNISIAGAVRGNVFGKKVQILRTGRVWGDITATALATEEGAFIEGKISMVSHAVQEAATASKAADSDEQSETSDTEDMGDAPMSGFPADEAGADPVDVPAEPDFLQADDMGGEERA